MEILLNGFIKLVEESVDGKVITHHIKTSNIIDLYECQRDNSKIYLIEVGKQTIQVCSKDYYDLLNYLGLNKE